MDLFPSHCEGCGDPLQKVPDPSPTRHQHTEMPPVDPKTIEWRRHACTCGKCGHTTRATYDDDLIPASPFGPRLMAILAILTGLRDEIFLLSAATANHTLRVDITPNMTCSRSRSRRELN